MASKRRRQRRGPRPQPPAPVSQNPDHARPAPVPTPHTVGRTQPVPNDGILLGLLQIIVPAVLAIAAGPILGRLALRLAGAGLAATGFTILVVALYRRTYAQQRGLRRWTAACCAAVGLVAFAASFLPLPVVSTTPFPPFRNHVSPATKMFSYFDKATANYQDIDVEFGYRGYVRQVFHATGTEFDSIAVIASAAPEDLADPSRFDPEHIGHVLLTLWMVDANGIRTTQVPLQPAGNAKREETAERGGIRAMAGPTSRDTVVTFEPVPTQPGDRYAFMVADDEPGVPLSFSLRPNGNADGPVYWDGATKNPTQAPNGRTNRAISGYVCNRPGGC
jgi:hypothetical protein